MLGGARARRAQPLPGTQFYGSPAEDDRPARRRSCRWRSSRCAATSSAAQPAGAAAHPLGPRVAARGDRPDLSSAWTRRTSTSGSRRSSGAPASDGPLREPVDLAWRAEGSRPSAAPSTGAHDLPFEAPIYEKAGSPPPTWGTARRRDPARADRARRARSFAFGPATPWRCCRQPARRARGARGPLHRHGAPPRERRPASASSCARHAPDRDYFESRLYARERRARPHILSARSPRLQRPTARSSRAHGTLEGRSRAADGDHLRSPLTYRLMMRNAALPYVGLPNILAASSSCRAAAGARNAGELEQALGNWLDTR